MDPVAFEDRIVGSGLRFQGSVGERGIDGQEEGREVKFDHEGFSPGWWMSDRDTAEGKG